MSRREYIERFQCAHAGCKEWFHYRYETKKAAREGVKRNAGGKCVRHLDDSTLALDKPTSTKTLVASKVPYDETRMLDGLFWCEPGSKNGSGFTFGPGFRAFASDFPEGTTITITATIEVAK